MRIEDQRNNKISLDTPQGKLYDCRAVAELINTNMTEPDPTSTGNSLSEKSILRKRIMQGLVVTFIFIFLVWAWPAAQAKYYQNRGGKVLQQVTTELDKGQSVTTYCYPPSLSDDQLISLKDASKLLEKSIAIKPNYEHTYLSHSTW